MFVEFFFLLLYYFNDSFRLSQLLATNRPGNHALARVKDALNEQDDKVIKLTTDLADIKIQSQQELAHTVLSRFFRAMGNRYASSAFLMWKQETLVDKPNEMLEAMKTKLNDQKTKLIYRFIRSLQQGILGKSFDRWATAVVTNKDSRTLLEKTRDEREQVSLFAY